MRRTNIVLGILVALLLTPGLGFGQTNFSSLTVDTLVINTNFHQSSSTDTNYILGTLGIGTSTPTPGYALDVSGWAKEQRLLVSNAYNGTVVVLIQNTSNSATASAGVQFINDTGDTSCSIIKQSSSNSSQAGYLILNNGGGIILVAAGTNLINAELRLNTSGPSSSRKLAMLSSGSTNFIYSSSGNMMIVVATNKTVQITGGLIVSNSLVVGLGTASGQNAVSEGNSTASGYGSHAEGGSTAGGALAHAEGYWTTASGDYGSHAEGSTTTASGSGSHSEGYFAEAYGTSSHAEGRWSSAAGTGSHAAGECANATNDNTYVWSDGTTVSSTTNRQYTVCATNGIRLMGGPTTVVPGGDISMGTFTSMP
jgi:hypothetical protein